MGYMGVTTWDHARATLAQHPGHIGITFFCFFHFAVKKLRAGFGS